jgi:hypothetical protein
MRTVFSLVSTASRVLWTLTVCIRMAGDGSLIAERVGPCLCPNDTAFTLISPIATTILSGCSACLRRPGTVHLQPSYQKLELLGLHFQTWKRRWDEAGAIAGGEASTALQGHCESNAGFDLHPSGFRCERARHT